MSITTKCRSVLTIWMVSEDGTDVGFRHEDDHDYEVDGHDRQGHVTPVFLSRRQWEDMGEPTSITVTVEPGDLLNEHYRAEDVGGSRGTTLNVPTGTPSAPTPSQPVGWNKLLRPPDSLGNSPVPERFRSVSGVE